MSGRTGHPTVIFLDDGGVMNDNSRRAAEWERLVGEFLSPRLGGDSKAWGLANRVVFERQWARFEAWNEARGEDGHGDFFAQRSERVRWLREMCAHAVVAPPDEDGSYRLACETDAYVSSRVRAEFPDSVETIRFLHGAGFRLSTASGHPSGDLEMILANMGVRAFFSERLYGPDLVRSLKNGPTFYRRIFAETSVRPSEALVVDDSARAAAWAEEAGARSVLVSRDGSNAGFDGMVIGRLSELPALLDA